MGLKKKAKQRKRTTYWKDRPGLVARMSGEFKTEAQISRAARKTSKSE